MSTAKTKEQLTDRQKYEQGIPLPNDRFSKVVQEIRQEEINEHNNKVQKLLDEYDYCECVNGKEGIYFSEFGEVSIVVIEDNGKYYTAKIPQGVDELEFYNLAKTVTRIVDQNTFEDNLYTLWSFNELGKLAVKIKGLPYISDKDYVRYTKLVNKAEPSFNKIKELLNTIL